MLDIKKVLELLKKTGTNPLFIILSVVFSLFAALFEGISVSLLLPLVNGIITMDFGFMKNLPAPAVFTILIAIIFAAAFLKNILQYAAAITISKQIRRFSNGLRKAIFARYLSFGKQFFDRNNTGSLANVLLNFTKTLTERLSSLEFISTQLFMLIAYLAIMFAISWKLTALTLLIFPVLNYSLKWLIAKLKKTSEYYADSHRAISGKISNILSCMPLVKAYSREKKEEEHFNYMSDRIEWLEFSMDKKGNLIAPIQEIIMLTAVLLLVSAMAFLVLKEKAASIGNLLVFFYLIKKSQTAFGVLNIIKSSLAREAGPMSAILEVLDDRDKFFVKAGEKIFPGLKDNIEFRGLRFSYGGGKEILKGVNFSVEKGKSVAIVGPTGSGKTTIINLLLRYYDCPPGAILIDGVDIRDFDLKSLRMRMALVSQDTLLFDDTIEKNITYGKEDKVSRLQLIDVVKKARLYDFIMSLPGKFDTYIGERGVKLSGGERQRVSIARALLKEAEVLLLDEATSSLDTKTEKLIQEAISEAVKDRTAIVVAHRLSTIKNSDKVVVLEDGRAVEEGPMDALIEKKGAFYGYSREQRFYL